MPLKKLNLAQIKFALLGVGVMGSAILENILVQKIFAPQQILAIDLNLQRLKRFACQGVQVTPELKAAQASEILLIALKPQQLKVALQDFQTQALVLSIVAGVSIQELKKLTGATKIVRAMPNTPAQIGAGITGVYYPRNLTVKLKKCLAKILAGLGTTLRVLREKDLASITAISGSGPAYFFAFAEGLIQAGEQLGLTPQQATTLVRETFFGSAKLAANSELSFTNLRQNVTSKGGTTEAALKEFQKKHLEKIIAQATLAAFRRATGGIK